MKNGFIVLVFTALVAMASCGKDPKPNTETFSILKEKERIVVGTDSVSIQGEFAFAGIVNSLKLRVGTDAQMHGTRDFEARLNGTTYSVAATGLTAGTLYHYVYVADYGALTEWQSEVYTFTTQSELPKVETLDVLMLDSLVARVKATVTHNGGAALTERGVCWNDYGDPTTDDAKLAHPENGLGEYTCRLTGLEPFKRYYVRAYAKSEVGTAYGAELEFVTGEEVNLPTVATVEVTGVMYSAASCLCSVSSDGGAPVSERGACWATHANPTIADYVYANGTGLGDYTIGMVELEPNTTYHVRAYAKNSKGINYGEELVFTTLEKLVMPLACIDGLYSVGEGRQVWFSQGNLMYRPSARHWDFFEWQYEYVGNDNTHIAENYTGTIDLFCWGTSGINHGAVCYQPWSVSSSYGDYYAYGLPGFHLYDQTGQADWGYNIVFEEGDEQTRPWRTLAIDEWTYVLFTRATPSGQRFAKAQVNGVNGVIMLPDDWSTAIYTLSNVNQVEASFTSNLLTAAAFRTLERHGAVFLPAAGLRNYTDVDYAGSEGNYWSATSRSEKYVWMLQFDSNHLDTDETRYRSKGYSVRLVRDAVRR